MATNAKDKLLWLAAASGALGIASEGIWLRWASLQGSDDRTAWLYTTCVFAIGACLGALLGASRPRLLPAIELIPGLWLAALGWLLSSGLFYWSVPTWACIAAMVPASLAIGAHAPLYSQLMPKDAFGRIQAVIAMMGAAALGLVGVFLAGVIPLSVQAMGCGILQAALGIVAVLALMKLPPNEDKLPTPFDVRPIRRLADAQALFVGLAGMWSVAVASRQISVMIETDRGIFVALTCASLTACAIGSFFGPKAKSPAAILLALPAAWVGAILLSPPFQLLLGMGSGIAGAFWREFLVCLLLCAPAAVTAAWYAASAAASARDTGHPEGSHAGRILALCAIGNMAGVLVAAKTGIWAAPLVLMVPPLLSWRESRLRFAIAAIALAAGSFILPATGLSEPVWMRTWTSYPGYSHIVDWDIRSQGLETYGIERRIPYDTRPPTEQELAPAPMSSIYVLNGHWFNALEEPNKRQLGLLAGRYFDGPLRNTLEIGIGTGQTLQGFAMISRHVDAVDYSPAIRDALDWIKDDNGDVVRNPRVSIRVEDGIDAIRDCEPGKYDAIMRTASGPDTGSASKFFGIEGILAMKRCLDPNGVFMAYFWTDIADDPDSIRTMLAPLAKAYKHVDIHWSPYPVAVAYDEDRATLHDPQRMPAILQEAKAEAMRDAKLQSMAKDAYHRHLILDPDIPNSVDGGEMDRGGSQRLWEQMGGARPHAFSEMIDAMKALPHR